MTYINRNMEPVFQSLSGEYPAVLITGPRQTGKTTMLQKLAREEGRDRVYVSLDNIKDRALAQKDPEMFFQLYRPPVFIDEVQYAPELFTYIKIHIDTNHRPGDFWLTGSQLFKLMRGVQESLAGRIALLQLLPLSQNETEAPRKAPSPVLSGPFKPDLDYLMEKQKHRKPAGLSEIFSRIFTGGMPALASGQYSNRENFYQSYINTYLDRDIKDLSETINSLKFYTFLVAVAARTGQLVNYASIAEESDIDHTTAKNWLRILETLGIIFYLHPYSNNTLKRTIKTPKLYFYDSAVAVYLTKWSSVETLQNGAMDGAFLENFAVSEIVKSYYNAGLEPFVYYYRDRDNKEIDLVLERDGTLFPLEIKKTAAPESRLTRVFSSLDNVSLRRGTGAILCMAEKLSAFDTANLIVPIRLL
ncbi:ATPase [Spirochaetia bacterium]|nr:ATPase [Spirochaetia bacterium]